jgi:hypothetical protein
VIPEDRKREYQRARAEAKRHYLGRDLQVAREHLSAETDPEVRDLLRDEIRHLSADLEVLR